MTQCFSFEATRPTTASSFGAQRTSRAWLLATSLALTACSTSLPLQLPKIGKQPSITAPAITAPTSTQPPSASTPPATPPTLSAAIADLFPAPSVHYLTPGLTQSPTGFTSNTQLTEWLATLQLPTSSERITPQLRAQPIGSSQQGQPITALIAATAAESSPAALEQNRNPTVLIVAGQSGTAPASTEAALAFAHKLTTDAALQELLHKVNVIVVPRANPDGFDLRHPGTANGTYLYRDHLTLHTPEARALANLVQSYQPSVVLELSEFDAIEPTLLRYNAVRANDVGLQYGVTPNGHEFLSKSVRTWLQQPLSSQLAAAGLRVDWRYSAYGRNASDGFAMDTIDPITLTNVSTLKNALGLAVDSRGADLGQEHLQRRIHSLVLTMQSVAQSTVQRAADIQKVQTFVERDVASQSCRKSMVVQAQPTLEDKDITLIDAASATLHTQRLAWHSSLEMRNQQQLPRPCGYWLSPEAADAAERLSTLGVQVQRIAELSTLQAQALDSTSTAVQALPAAPGSYYISMNQPLANVAIAALEPGNAYSYSQTGLLTTLDNVKRITMPASLVFEDE